LSSSDPLIGQIIGGRYEVVRLIGRGGMGAIYEVRNTRLGRSFAMKTLFGDAASDLEVLARFRREADVVARIKHPNIVEVIDWESLEDGSPCIILEYLQGEDLSHRIREAAPMPWLFIAKVGDQILSALSVAHAANVIHRDLKPQNIFLALDDTGEERAKLLDFGVSKIRDSRSLVTTDARLLGTPSYMSPEQAEGRHDDIGPATDLWAMATILHEMATGDLTFNGASMPAVLYRICSKDAEPVDVKRPDAPPAFTQLLREALSRDPDQRIDDATVFRARLREALADVAPQVRYSDKVLAPRAPMATPLPASPTPTRPKRQTGALDKTITPGLRTGQDEATANTVVSGTFEKPSLVTPTPVGQISASTLPPPKRRPGLLIAIGTVATSMIVVAIVVATTRSGARTTQPAEPPSPPPLKAVEPAAPIVVDAGAPVIEVDAAIVVEPVKPVVKRDPPRRPARQDPPKQDPPKQDPPKQDPPKQDPPKRGKCDQFDKKSEKYIECIMGDGT
jgi:serine/threonine-protein kinase